MLIEIPLLIIISLWLWKILILQNVNSIEFTDSYSKFLILCQLISIFWYITYYPSLYPNFILELIISSLFITIIIIFIFKDCDKSLIIFILGCAFTYLFIRILIDIKRTSFIYFLTLLDFSIPIIWIAYFKIKSRITKKSVQ